MKPLHRIALVLCLAIGFAFTTRADDEHLPMLKIGSDTYSNVTVTTVSANGQTIFISRFSAVKFCEPGTTPGGEEVRPSNP
jgi:hypothetical protein